MKINSLKAYPMTRQTKRLVEKSLNSVPGNILVRGVFRAQSNIYQEVSFFAKIANGFYLLTIFAKKLDRIIMEKKIMGHTV